MKDIVITKPPRLESIADYRYIHHDSTHINIGTGMYGDQIIDIGSNPNVIIAGSPGSGKTVVLTNIIANGLCNDSVRVHIISGMDEESCDYVKDNLPLRDGDEFITNDSIYDVMAAINRIYDVMTSRFRRMRSMDDDDIIPNKGMVDYLIIDNAERILSINDGDDDVKLFIRNKLSQICSLGRAAGISVFIGTRAMIPQSILINMTNRIIMGYGSSFITNSMFNGSARFSVSPSLRGRGIISTNGNQELFQSRYISLP